MDVTFCIVGCSCADATQQFRLLCADTGLLKKAESSGSRRMCLAGDDAADKHSCRAARPRNQRTGCFSARPGFLVFLVLRAEGVSNEEKNSGRIVHLSWTGGME